MQKWEMKGKPALLILHMQQGIVGEKGIIPGLFEAVKEMGIIPRQQALLKAFRAKKLPVIYLVAYTVNKVQNPPGALPAYGNIFRLIEETEVIPNNMKVIPELAPRPGEPVLSNWFIGAFSNSGLDQVLRARGAETLVLSGCITHVAVYTAAMQAIELMYSVIIAGDACAAPKSAVRAHEIVLEEMGPNIALVTGSEDIIAHLK
jgi:nicotinamidase-related amidase